MGALTVAVARKDAKSAFGLIWAYRLVGDDGENWNVLSLDLNIVTAQLQQVLDQKRGLVEEIDGFWGQVISVKGILPGLRVD